MLRSSISVALGLFVLASYACSSPSKSQEKSASTGPIHRFVHWNIKELDSTKVQAYLLANPMNDEERSRLSSSTLEKFRQVKSAGKILGDMNPELLSLNEIQYDVDKAESAIAAQFCDFSQVKAERKRLDVTQNHDFFLNLAFAEQSWESTFCPANTGAAAQRDGDKFLSDRPNESDPDFKRKDALLDKINFGWTPGQYSSVFASSLSITDRHVNAGITWNEWDPSFDIKTFDLGFSNINYKDKTLTDSMIEAQALAANLDQDQYKTYPLFDKNFNISWVEIEGRSVAVVTFHTVPAFGFDREGKSVNPNPERNKAQLEFLEWYLLGSCDSASASPVKRCEEKFHIKPLEGKQSFIAVGDLNVAIDSPVYPGSRVLQRLLSHPLVANSGLATQKFGLPMIREPNLPAEVVAKMQNGGLKAEDFGGFHPYTTFIPYGFDFKGRGKSKTEQLDYFIVSADLNIHRLETHFVNPEFKDYGCIADKVEADRIIAEEKAQGRALDIFMKDIRDKVTNAVISRQSCIKSGAAAYGELREGSDHLPIILEFSFKN